MTTQDKTGQKLVDSIRKTKAGAAAAPAQAQETATKPKASVRRKPAAKPKPAARKESRDPYQSGGRVWPD